MNSPFGYLFREFWRGWCSGLFRGGFGVVSIRESHEITGKTTISIPKQIGTNINIL